MASPLVDFSTLNCTDNLVPEETLRKALPHINEFQLIDGICTVDVEREIVVGYKVWDEEPWWGLAHIPGRPMMPGVLMIEGCAQIAAILVENFGEFPDDKFMALVGVDNTRVRRMIQPPATVYFAGTLASHSSRIAKVKAQCIIDGEIAVETELRGVPV